MNKSFLLLIKVPKKCFHLWIHCPCATSLLLDHMLSLFFLAREDKKVHKRFFVKSIGP